MADDADASAVELTKPAAPGPSEQSDTKSQRSVDEQPTDEDVDSHDDAGESANDAASESGSGDVQSADAKRGRRRTALIAGLVIVLVLGSVVGWLGVGAYQARQAAERRELFLQVGRQGAINLTTIDFGQADADVRRILDSATGTFYDDFSKRSQPFVDLVKKVRSKSVGTITAAGVESESADQAQVLVAITVKTSDASSTEMPPHAWRMRIAVQRLGDQTKVSNVEFVP
jgi:Mce-associated membrane protein